LDIILKINENVNEIPKILETKEGLNLSGFEILIHEKKN